MANLFDSPWKILVVAVVIIVLFGSRKLPDAARSLGKSMRILKTEVQGMHEDDDKPASDRPAAQLPASQLQASATADDKQAQIDALQKQLNELKDSPATEAQQTR